VQQFSPKVLVERVKRVLRKKVEGDLTRKTVSIHDVVIDPARHRVAIQDKRVLLTLTEFNILYTMARRPGMVFTRYQIVDAVHGDNYLVTDRAVDVQIAYLRRKLGPARKYIETIRGVGYRFRD
jgi:two-component system phosphate regulon response regulator PhoB